MSKGILNAAKAHQGETTWLTCCWDDCERQGVDAHKALFHDHARGLTCDDILSTHLWYVFCSERHRQLFLNSHRIGHGKLPVGYRGSML